jgi:hypothetical protein
MIAELEKADSPNLSVPTKQKSHLSMASLLGRGERTQTFDLPVPNRARYQLRHTPMVLTWSIIPKSG